MKDFRLIIMGYPLLCARLLSVSAHGMKATTSSMSVARDHQDWNYKVGEKANFVVNVRKSGTLLDNVKVDFEAGPVMYPDVKKSIT